VNTYKIATSTPEWASQSRVVHSGAKMDGHNRWGVQIMRRRSRYGGREKRGFTVFASAGRLRGELGTR
jgi:hypothetical protein